MDNDSFLGKRGMPSRRAGLFSMITVASHEPRAASPAIAVETFLHFPPKKVVRASPEILQANSHR
jgi:hypothetical protein